MSEEEIIKYIKDEIESCKNIEKLYPDKDNIERKEVEEYQNVLQSLLDLYNKEKEKNKELEKQIELDKIQRLEYQKFLVQDFISKYKINEKIEEYEEILDSPIIKEDYKKEVEHIIRVLKELKGDN